MTRLEISQRGLLDLIKNRGNPPKDSYLGRVARSREIAMVREIALWWRAFDLEVQCGFSVRLLKRLGRFHAAVAKYFDDGPTSPFVEELSRDFLTWLQGDTEPLVRTVSFFERALLLTRTGDTRAFEVVWDRNPELLFRSLEDGNEIPATELGYQYRMVIARDLPHFVACTRKPAGGGRPFE